MCVCACVCAYVCACLYVRVGIATGNTKAVRTKPSLSRKKVRRTVPITHTYIGPMLLDSAALADFLQPDTLQHACAHMCVWVILCMCVRLCT